MSSWADSRGLTEVEAAVAANQWQGVPLPPYIAQWLNTQAGGGSPQDQWNNFVRTAQDRESGDAWYESPSVAFAALTGGLGGMTGANLATGGDVGKGVGMDLAALGAGAGLAAALPAVGLSAPAAGAVAGGTALATGTSAAANAGGPQGGTMGIEDPFSWMSEADYGGAIPGGDGGMSGDPFGWMTEADYGNAANPWSTDPSFADLGGDIDPVTGMPRASSFLSSIPAALRSMLPASLGGALGGLGSLLPSGRQVSLYGSPAYLLLDTRTNNPVLIRAGWRTRCRWRM
jgi:hypothetical protein